MCKHHSYTNGHNIHFTVTGEENFSMGVTSLTVARFNQPDVAMNSLGKLRSFSQWFLWLFPTANPWQAMRQLTKISLTKLSLQIYIPILHTCIVHMQTYNAIGNSTWIANCLNTSRTITCTAWNLKLTLQQCSLMSPDPFPH